MVDERQLNVVIGMTFRPNDSVQQARTTAERIQDILKRATQTPQSAFDISTAAKFGDELRAQINKALSIDATRSPLFQSMRQRDQQLVTSTTATDPSRFVAERIRLAMAELNRAAVQKRSRIPIGNEGSFGSDLERTQAQLRSAAQVENANRALASAEERYVRQLQRQEQDGQRLQVALGQEINAILRRQQREDAALRSEEEARAREIVALNRRAAADEAAAQKEAQLSAQRVEADRARQQFQTPYPDASASSELGRAQSRVNQAAFTMEIAQRRRTATLDAETRTAEQVLAADRQVLAASSALARAREQVASIEARQGQQQGSGGFGSDFLTGFHGRSDRPYAEQIGQAFKFSIFYGTAYKALFALTQTFQQTLQEGIDFQQAVTELKLSAGRADESMNALADQLGQRSVEAGFAPSQGVLVGARSIGLYGASQASAAEQARIADISARVVSRIALSSGQQPADIQTNIAAISQAFGGGPESQFRIADLDAYMSHFFGVPVGSTIQAVSESGTVGRAAGFSQEQVNAIAADLMSRTGQTAPAVAGFMAQIFSRGGEGSLATVANRYGIDATQELSDQIKQLADIYKQATPQERAQISAAFGRGKVQNAAIALLQDYQAVQDAAAGARTGSAGSSDKQFQLRLANIGGQIQLTTGTFKEFANELGQSGLLSAIGAGIVVFRELVSAGTGLLRLWNMLDGPMKAAIAGLAALAVAARSGALSSVAGATVFRSAGGLYAGGTAITAGRLAVATEAGAVAPLASRAGVAALAGGAGATLAAGAAALINPVTLAIAGLVAVGALKQKADQLGRAQDAATASLQSTLGPGSTADDYAAHAAALRAAAKDQMDATSGIWGSASSFALQYVPGVDNGYLSGRQSVARLNTAAGAEDAIGAAIARMDAKAASTTTTSAAITSFDADGLKTAMDQITTAGGTAENRFRALADALNGSTAAAKNAADAFDPGKFTLQSVDPILQALTGGLSTDKANAVRDTFDPASVIRSVRGRLDGRNLASLSDKQISQMASGIIEDSHAVRAGLNGDEMNAARQAVVDYLTGQRDSLNAILQGAKGMTGPQVTASVDLLVQTANDNLGLLQNTDYSGRIAILRRTVRVIENAIRDSVDPATPETLHQLAAVRVQIAESQITQLEAMRKAAQQNAHGARQVSQIGRQFYAREVQAAVRGGAQDALVNLIGQAGAWGRQVALQAINDAIDAARAAARVRQQAIDLYTSAITRFTGVKAPKSQEQKHLEDLKKMRDAAKNSITGGKDNTFDTGGDVPGVGDAATQAARETAAERAAALAAANATRSGSGIAAARASMQSAQAAMAKAKKGTVEYYQALGSYYDARNQLTDAVLQYRQNKYLLGIDITDPVAQARAALRAARDKLRADAGKSDEVRAADKVDVRQQQAATEAAAFQKRLDSVQTAEQLGRISHQKYLNYLQHEHDRLEAVKHRTYQQQQELNQIDGLMKDAASAMAGQWNFGDIKLPTGYQVRRYIEQNFPAPGSRAGDLGGGSGGRPMTQVNNNIHINGADTGMVRKILRDAVSEYAGTITTKHRHE